MMQKIIPWILAIFVAFVFIQSLFFNFSGSEETVIIFNTIADWMADIALLEAVAEPFRTYSGNTIGVLELVASALILIPATLRVKLESEFIYPIRLLRIGLLTL